jgi:hypothetical protein
MKHIFLFESWERFHTHTFNDREEFENFIMHCVNSNNVDFEIDYATGDIYDTSFGIYDDNAEKMMYGDEAYMGSLQDNYINLGGEKFIFDENYKSLLDWAQEFKDYIKGKGVEYVKIHEAQTGTVYITFEAPDGEDYKVRISDHSDAYANSDFNFAATPDNSDGGNWKQLLNWFESLK